MRGEPSLKSKFLWKHAGMTKLYYYNHSKSISCMPSNSIARLPQEYHENTIACWTTVTVIRLRSTIIINITGRSTSLSMKMSGCCGLQVSYGWHTKSGVHRTIIGLLACAVYDIFTLAIASQAYAISLAKASAITNATDWYAESDIV